MGLCRHTPKERKPVGYIIAGSNPVYFDQVVSTLMGFDYKKIPAIQRAANQTGEYLLCNNQDEKYILSNISDYNNITIEELKQKRLLNFEPASGWKGHIEIERQ